MKPHITATDLYNFKKCAYRPFMDYNGDPALKIEIHPLVKLLWESGVQYEAKVIEAYRRDHPDLTFRSFADAQDDKASAQDDNCAHDDKAALAAMQEGIDVIYQGTLISGNKVGRPDMLLKTSGKSNLGDYHYAPMDIKLTRIDGEWDDGNEKVAIEQFWQVYFYGQILAAVQGRLPDKGYIYKTKRRIFPIPLTKPPANYEWAISQLENYLQGNAFGAEPCINSNCGLCEWRDVCAQWAQEKQDVSLVYYVGQAMKEGLKKLGIETISDLAAQDPDQLSEKVQALKSQGFFWKQMPADLPEKSVMRARIQLSGTPVIHQPIVFPDSDVEIHFDVEDDPTQDFVYLHGILLAKKGQPPEYHAFFAENRDDEGLITQQLFDFFNQYPTAPVYHYSDYEKTTLKRLIQKHQLDSAVYDRLFGKNGTAIDLYKTITANTDWPLTSYSVKAICKFLGFKWDAADAGGAASIVWMNEYLSGNPAMKQKILRYNEDDLQATYFLKDKLIEMQNE